MARVTVEDCTLVLPSKFELVAIAAQRAKEISSGAKLTVDRDNDKNPVVALREIAGRTVSTDLLKEAIIQKNQKLQNFEEQDLPDEDEMSLEIATEIQSLNQVPASEKLSDMFSDEADEADESSEVEETEE